MCKGKMNVYITIFLCKNNKTSLSCISYTEDSELRKNNVDFLCFFMKPQIWFGLLTMVPCALGVSHLGGSANTFAEGM